MDSDDQSLIPTAITKRQYPRATLVTQIQCEEAGHTQVMVTQNVSAGGMFIAARIPIPIDTELSVTFRLYSEEPAITCRARVAFSDVGLGMGIQFLDLGEPAFQSLEKFVDEAA